MLGAELGLPVAHLDSHASYIEHWLKLLKDDDRAILTAAARAEEAASLLLKLGGRTTLAGDGDDISDAVGDDTADALAAGGEKIDGTFCQLSARRSCCIPDA